MKDATFSAARLLELYDRISDAEDAIPRLRRFVLDLAVRGKLVTQDTSEEPATELLKRIAAERKRRIEIGELKKSKGLPAPKLADHLFKVPRTWIWTVADHVWDFENGDRGKNYPSRDQLVDNGIPFVNAGHLVDGRVNMSEMNFVTPEKFLQIGGGKLRKGDQIYCLRGSLGKHAVFDLETDAAIASSLVILRPVVPDCVPYLSLFLDSDIAVVLLRRFDNGSAQPNLSSANLRKYDVPLPPLAEQHRIVAKVDELMALCDQLEQARAGREAVRDRLTTASLARLTAPETDTEALPVEVGTALSSGNATKTSTFQSHARFALQSLPTLTTRPDQIKTLRQTILNLAVRGKLVEQDPTDEPAGELLKRIEAEKAARFAGGRAQMMMELVAVSADEQDFEIPETWLWTRLGSVIKLWNGFAFKSSDFKTTGTPVIRIGDLADGEVKLSSSVHVSSEVANSVSDEVWIPEDALLLAMSGATTGKTAFNRTGQKLLLNQRVGRIETFSMNMNFIRFFFETIIARNLSISLGTAIPNLSTKQINETAIPLPPLAEQHRIVAKVDALMALCDQLEASLTTTATTRSKLLNALLHKALEPAADELEAAE